MSPSRLLLYLLVVAVILTLLTEESEAQRRRRRRRRRRRQREGRGVGGRRLVGEGGTLVEGRRGSRRIRHAKGRRAEFVRRRLRKARRRKVEGRVRLIDGRADWEGNVQVWHSGSWGNICDDEWDDREGEIVCRQLGFPGVERVTYTGFYGKAKTRFWMDNLFCVGTEKNLTECSFDGWGHHDCETDEAAGLVCRSHFAATTSLPTLPPRDQPHITNKTKLALSLEGKIQLRLVGGRTPQEGRVEILLPRRTPQQTPRPTRRKSESDGKGAGVDSSKVKNDTNRRVESGARGRVESEDCRTNVSSRNRTIKGGIDLENNINDDTGNGTTETEGCSQNTSSTNIESRGNNDLEGSDPEDEESIEIESEVRDKRDVEVVSDEEEEQWGMVCGDGWSLLEAMVVCRQLGFGFAQTAVSTGYFGGNMSDLVLSGVKCTGNEGLLEHCLHNELGDVFCPHMDHDANIAGVSCVSRMADLVPDHIELARSAHLEDKQLFFLSCAMEENCLAASAKTAMDSGYGWHLDTRRLLRFTARIVNQGDEAFRPFLPKQYWEWHACHMHYHSMEVFAHYDIIDAQGNRVAEGHKASFCLEDNNCLPSVTPTFKCANYGDQGISPGCTDTYAYNIDCQWVDITDLKPGTYTFKVAVNPEFKVSERSFDNNAAVCELIYNETSAWVGNCTLGRP